MILVIVEDDACGTVGGAGDDCYHVAGFDPAATMLEGAGSRCIDFGGEVVCEKQDVHGRFRKSRNRDQW